MIGKGRFFDLISRMADDANNPGLQIRDMIGNYQLKEEKYFNQINSKNMNEETLIK